MTVWKNLMCMLLRISFSSIAIVSASEIAQRLGYINLSHFTASFKQITNMTPVNYRKKY